jgi:signal peptidase I
MNDAPRRTATVEGLSARGTDLAQTNETAAKPGSGRKAGRAVREIVETLILAALIFFAVRLVVLNFRVDGQSMVPNLQNEQMLLVNRNAYRSLDLSPIDGLLPGDDADGANTFYPFDPPERGDIIVFDPPTNSDHPTSSGSLAFPANKSRSGAGRCS